MDGRMDGGEREDKGNPEASTGTWIKGDGAARRRCAHQSYKLFSRHRRTMSWGARGGFVVPETGSTAEKMGELEAKKGAP